MKIDGKIRYEKQIRYEYDFNKKNAKMSASSSRKIVQYKCFTGEETICSTQSRIIEQAKFTYSLLSRAINKQIKTIENHGEK